MGESGPLEVEDVLGGGGGDDETLSHRLRYRGRRMGDRVGSSNSCFSFHTF